MSVQSRHSCLAVRTHRQTYAGATAAGLATLEPTLTYITAASTVAAPSVSVMTTPTATNWGAARMSVSGTCYGIRDTIDTTTPANSGTWYGIGIGTCTGDFAATAANTPDRSWT
jgi:hypothetical protein